MLCAEENAGELSPTELTSPIDDLGDKLIQQPAVPLLEKAQGHLLYNLIIKTILQLENRRDIVILKTIEKNIKAMYIKDEYICQIEQIGKGSFGVVLKITKKNGFSYVLKTGSHKDISYESFNIEMLKQGGGNEYVIKTLSPPVVDNNIMAIVLPFYDTDLRKIIFSEQTLTDNHIKCILVHILIGLNHIHKKNIIHADLKPANILIQANPLKCIIADLGIAQHIDANGLDIHICSRWYRPPEVILKQPYSYSVDIWSFGCILYELITGNILFKGDQCGDLSCYEELSRKPYNVKGGMFDLIEENVKTMRAEKKLAIEIRIRNYDTKLLDLFQQCMKINKDERITAENALKHPSLIDCVEWIELSKK